MALLFIFLLHIGAAAAAFYISDWTIFVVSFVAWYQLSHLFGLSIVYHKLFSHRSFVPKTGVAELGALINILSFKGTPDVYALIHRIHHRHSDTDLDPHTSKDQWYRGYFGILFPNKILEKFSPREKRDFVKDVYVDFRWVKQLTFKVRLALLIVFYTTIFIIDQNLLAGVLCGSVVSIHIGLMINLFGHRKVNNNMVTVNRPWIAAWFGPSFNHNYHHTYPRSYHEAGPGRFELASWLIKNFLSKSA